MNIIRAKRNGARVSWLSTTIDRESVLAASSHVAHHASLRSATLGRHTSIGRFSKVAFADIGSFCSVSWDVTIGAIGHPMDHLTSHAFPYVPELGISQDPRNQSVERVKIGHDVWIGTQVIVMPGVTIGNGAIVGAGSVVTKDVPAYTVVAGVPARQIKQRFSEEETELVEKSRWWELTDSQLRQALPAFRTNDIRKAVDQLSELS